MASKQPHKIVVNGLEFRWKAEIRAEQSERVVELRVWQVRAGGTLIARLVGSPPAYIDTAYPTPNAVRIILEYAIAKGWNYKERSLDLHLSSADKIDLENLRLPG